MRRRLLIITKEPEFDVRGEVVLGQCEPFTSGWRLIMVDPSNNRETLLTGTYTDLRKIQDSCSSIDDPAHVKRRVNDMRALLMSSVTETVAVRFDQQSSHDVTKPLEPITSIMPAVPTCTPGGLLNLEPTNGVLVATVVQPERADDAHYLKHEMQTLLECHPKAVLMDLGRVPNLSPGTFRELAGMRDRLRETGAGFALCNVTGAMQQNMRAVISKDTLPVFENTTKGVAALNGNG